MLEKLLKCKKNKTVDWREQMSLWPKISIITPSFNQGEFIEKTILSVVEQKYPNLEYIIFDGGSTDNSIDVIKKYDKKISYWVSEPDSGQSQAINKGFERATGELLFWLNTDDFFLPGALEKIVSAYQKYPDKGVYAGLGRTVDAKGAVRRTDQPVADITIEKLYRWLDNNNFCQPATAFRKNIWDRYGPFDETLHLAFDLDFWLKLAKNNVQFHLINHILAHEVNHRAAKTRQNKYANIAEIALVIIKHGGADYVKSDLENMAKDAFFYKKKYTRIYANPIYRGIFAIENFVVGIKKRTK